MYIPAHFREENLELLHTVMREYSFATLISTVEGHPFVSHLPFLLDAARGPQGTLRAHLARANPHWKELGDGQEALIVFQGPHTYISPSWYETHPSVPTWNYIAVHAYGIPRLVDGDELYAILKDLVNTYETGSLQPWQMDLPDDYLQKMMRAIVGFEMEITRLEGKFKLGQNRINADYASVVAVLEQSTRALDQEVAAWMRRYEAE